MGRFIVRTADNGEYYFVLKARNGEIIATSEMYTSPQACYKGIRSVRLNAPLARLRKL